MSEQWIRFRVFRVTTFHDSSRIVFVEKKPLTNSSTWSTSGVLLTCRTEDNCEVQEKPQNFATNKRWRKALGEGVGGDKGTENPNQDRTPPPKNKPPENVYMHKCPLSYTFSLFTALDSFIAAIKLATPSLAVPQHMGSRRSSSETSPASSQF